MGLTLSPQYNPRTGYYRELTLLIFKDSYDDEKFSVSSHSLGYSMCSSDSKYLR